MNGLRSTEDTRSELAPSIISYQYNSGKHQFRLNRSNFSDPEYALFNNLENILQELSSIATATQTEQLSDVFGNAEIYCKRLFQRMYNQDIEVTLLQDIYEGFKWSKNGSKEQTITIEKTSDELIITYERGFFADEEVLTVNTTEGYTCQGCTVACSIRQAAAGITAEHFPSKPKRTQRWRRKTPSKIQISITGSKNEVKIGLSNTPPSPPLWYKLQRMVVFDCEPSAYTTFDLSSQTKERKRLFYTPKNE